MAAAKTFKRLARVPLGETAHSTPAVVGGTIYLRTASHLMALGAIREPEGTAEQRK